MELLVLLSVLTVLSPILGQPLPILRNLPNMSNLPNMQNMSNSGGRGGVPRVPSIPTIPRVPPPPSATVRPQPRPPQGPMVPRSRNVAQAGSPDTFRRVVSGGNGGGGSTQNTACSAAGRNAIAQCFQSNGGFQMQNVIALMSRGAQGNMPTNPNRMKQALCSSEGTIVACVFEGINRMENTVQCPAPVDFSRLEQETVNLITGVQLLCGKGQIPASSPCLANLNLNLQACFTEVGLDPNMFLPIDTKLHNTGNLTKMMGAIIGDNPKAANRFCSIKERLFTCMKIVMDKCEGSKEVAALSGFEPDSLRKGIEVLCHDVNVYMDGLRCFQKVPTEADRCYDNMEERVMELTAQQLQNSQPLQQFYDKFCQARIQHMECDLQAWRSQCKASALGLKNEFECNLLPSRCKNDRTLQGRLQQVCAIKRFQRHLRSSAESSLTLTSVVTMAISVLLAIVF